MPSILCVIILTLGPAQPNPQPTQDNRARVEPIADPGGFWPTDKMIHLFMQRWSDEVSERYRLDASQKAQWAGKLSERWTRFSHGNRGEMQPMLNEFIEMRLGMKPPSGEQVKAWASRASPAFEKLKEELTAGSKELRGFLKPGQRAKFDTDLMGFTMGLQVARSKLDLWKEGEFNERDFWDPPGSERRRRRAEAQAAKGEAPPEADVPPDQIELELDSWQEYVNRFIRIYKLDEAQKATAFSVLKELRERAIAHRDRHRVEIEKLERRVEAHDGSQEDLAEIEEQLTAMYGPIDTMFEELKTRLNSVPTEAQRASVARRDREDRDQLKD